MVHCEWHVINWLPKGRKEGKLGGWEGGRKGKGGGEKEKGGRKKGEKTLVCSIY